MEINLPILPLRPYQEVVWDKLFKDNIKKAMLVWHRRAGKDLFCLQYMIAKAILQKGNYFYILPHQNQVRRAIWEGITATGFKYLSCCPDKLILKKQENEMKLVLRDIQHPNQAGSIISFLGGDSYDNLVGAGIKGAVISEFALQRPALYNQALEPMLRETDGWVLFNTTPRGNNHAKEMFDFLKQDKKYLTSLLTIEDTGFINPSDLEEERKRGKPEELIRQEYYCSFEGAAQGAYYADLLNNHAENYGDFPYDGRFPVHTVWDLGVSDSMAIWFVQFAQGTVRVIDYYENNGFGLGHYANIILSKKYLYAGHHLPHDGRQRQLTATEKALTVAAQLQSLGLEKIEVCPRTQDIYADICAVRGLLPVCFFHQKTTATGYQALQNYKRDYDENRKCFKDTPLHDWTSHGADAFRLIPFIYQSKKKKNIQKEPKRWNGRF